MKTQNSIYAALPVLFGFFVMGFCDIVGISSDYVQRTFNWSPVMTGFVPSLVFIWFLFLGIPIGNQMNKWGRKNTVLLSMGITVVGMLLPLIVYNSATCMIAYALLGIGNAILQVSLNPLLSNVVTSQRLLTSSLTAGQVIKAVSSLVGPEIVLLAVAHFGDDKWYYCFPILGFITLLSAVYKALFWFGSITSLFLLLAAFTASNTMLYESADYMAIGMLVSLCYAERETLESPVFWKSFVLLFVGLAVIHKGFLLYNIYGHDTIFVTRQKAEEGPMAGIYGRYSDGYEYNIRGRLLDEFIPRGSKVLIASHKSIMYLQEDYVICNYSTISTPTIDERLFQYWTLYPDKVPEYIVWDKGSEGYIATNPEVNARLVENAELLVDDEGLLIYRLPANPY